MKISKTVVLMVFFITLNFVGGAFAASTKIVDRTEYSTSLNSVASVVMNWYGSLISAGKIKNTKNKTNFDTTNIDVKWDEYRSKYPKDILQIIITSTKLSKLEDSGDYQFKVKTKITFKEKNSAHTQSLSETFVFENTLLTTINNSTIKRISRDEKDAVETINIDGFNRSHYKVREFTYAWLTYIDGIQTLATTMNAKSWLNDASYSLKIGSNQLTATIQKALEKKKQFLTTGGHLLKSLEIKRKNKEGADMPSNIFVIDLILEWKGTNKTGKPVVARIHQEIKVKINTDKTWKILSIDEEHLLPIIAPWMGLVC